MWCTRSSRDFCFLFSFSLSFVFGSVREGFWDRLVVLNAMTEELMGVVVSRARRILELVARCLVYSLIIAFATVIVVVLFTQVPVQVVAWAALALLGEGGLMMVVGGVVSLFSPALGKIGEVVFRSEPWNAKRLRETEGTARMWIVTGFFLFLFGLLVSAF
jgi:hypothetical protein